MIEVVRRRVHGGSKERLVYRSEMSGSKSAGAATGPTVARGRSSNLQTNSPLAALGYISSHEPLPETVRDWTGKREDCHRLVFVRNLGLSVSGDCPDARNSWPVQLIPRFDPCCLGTLHNCFNRNFLQLSRLAWHFPTLASRYASLRFPPGALPLFQKTGQAHTRTEKCLSIRIWLGTMSQSAN